MLFYIKYSDNPYAEIKTSIEKAQPKFHAEIERPIQRRRGRAGQSPEGAQPCAAKPHLGEPWFPAKLKKIREKGLLVLKQIHPETWFTHKLLYTSSHLFLIPFFVYLFTEQSRIQSVLFSALFSNFVFSIAFWHDPIKGSLVHRIDAAAARTSFSMLLLYVIFLRSLSWVGYIWFTLSILTTVLFFYMSNVYSSYEWCCMEHILCHFMAHIFTFISILFAIV